MSLVLNNRAFIRVKMIGFDKDIVLCFKNRDAMIHTEGDLLRIIDMYKLNYPNNTHNRFYLMDQDRTKRILYGNKLNQARTYWCVRDPDAVVNRSRRMFYKY